MDDADATIHVPNRGLRRALILASALVPSLGLAAELGRAAWGWDEAGAVSYVSLSWEGNVPTWYTAALLLFCATLLAICAAEAKHRGGEPVAAWWALCVGFLYISMDEVSQLHELAAFLETSGGVLYFSWVIPASIVVVVVGLSFMPFLRCLEPRMRWRFVIAGAIYVSGAVGMELPLGWWTHRYGDENLGYALIDWVEETLEILGLTLFALALLERLRSRGVHVRFATSHGAPRGNEGQAR